MSILVGLDLDKENSLVHYRKCNFKCYAYLSRFSHNNLIMEWSLEIKITTIHSTI